MLVPMLMPMLMPMLKVILIGTPQWRAIGAKCLCGKLPAKVQRW